MKTARKFHVKSWPTQLLVGGLGVLLLCIRPLNLTNPTLASLDVTIAICFMLVAIQELIRRHWTLTLSPTEFGSYDRWGRKWTIAYEDIGEVTHFDPRYGNNYVYPKTGPGFLTIPRFLQDQVGFMQAIVELVPVGNPLHVWAAQNLSIWRKS